jgi:hypothetical protein
LIFRTRAESTLFISRGNICRSTLLTSMKKRFKSKNKKFLIVLLSYLTWHINYIKLFVIHIFLLEKNLIELHLQRKYYQFTFWKQLLLWYFLLEYMGEVTFLFQIPFKFVIAFTSGQMKRQVALLKDQKLLVPFRCRRHPETPSWTVPAIHVVLWQRWFNKSILCPNTLSFERSFNWGKGANIIHLFWIDTALSIIHFYFNELKIN